MRHWLCLFLMLMATIGSAQNLLEQYWGVAGGRLAGRFLDDNEDTYTNVLLNVTLGKTLGKDYIAGFGFSAGMDIQQNIKRPDNRLSTSRTEIGLFLQYHFLQTSRATIYTQPTLLFSKRYATTDAISLSSSGDRIDYFRGSLGLGINYFLTSNVAFNFSGNFSVFEQVTTETDNLSDSGNTNFAIGFQYFIGHYKAIQSLPHRKAPNYAVQSRSWSVEASFNLLNQLAEPRVLTMTLGTNYFLFNHLSIGMNAEGEYNLEQQTYQFGLRSGLRLYIPFQINYLLLEANIGAQQRRQVELGVTSYHPFVFAEGRLGFGLFMSENVALQTTGYFRQYSPWDNGFDGSIRYLGLGANIGIVYFFRRNITK